MKAQYDASGFVVGQVRFVASRVRALRQQIDSLSLGVAVPEQPTIDVRDGFVFQIFDVPRRPPPLGELPRDPLLTRVAQELVGSRVVVAWALVLNKVRSPTANWAVPWHQDTSVYCTHIPPDASGELRAGFATFRPTDHSVANLTVARVALDRDTTTSGCLRVLPGSHKWGRVSGGEGGRLGGHAGTAIELEPGDVAFFNPLLMHRADENRTSSQRRVVHIYYRPVGMPLQGTGWIDWYGVAAPSH